MFRTQESGSPRREQASSQDVHWIERQAFQPAEGKKLTTGGYGGPACPFADVNFDPVGLVFKLLDAFPYLLAAPVCPLQPAALRSVGWRRQQSWFECDVRQRQRACAQSYLFRSSLCNFDLYNYDQPHPWTPILVKSIQMGVCH